MNILKYIKNLFENDGRDYFNCPLIAFDFKEGGYIYTYRWHPNLKLKMGDVIEIQGICIINPTTKYKTILPVQFEIINSPQADCSGNMNIMLYPKPNLDCMSKLPKKGDKIIIVGN